MFPEEFRKRILKQKYINAEELLKALEEPSPVSIRINASKWDMRPSDADTVPWCKTGFYLTDRPSYTLDPLFHSGCYYPQEASSMFLEQAIKQTSGSLENIHVLDLCGAPGGKSTHLADLIGTDSLLIANEVIRSRSLILSENVTKWGRVNTLVTQNDPSHFGRLPGFFDIILVDAPCSGEGMFRNNIAVSEWSDENAFHCSERQKRIVMDIWPSLKEDGILIFSTCTFNPGENEGNIKWLIERNKAECMRLNINGFKGITEIDFDGIYGYGFYPDKVRGEGFFISVLKKRGKQEKISFRKKHVAELKPSKRDIEITEGWTNFRRERILRWSEELFALPCEMNDYIHLFHILNVVKKGTILALVKKNDYIPSHELALSDYLKTGAFPRQQLDYATAISYLRRDNILFPDSPGGWIALTYNGINLGFVKNLGKRINNYYPVEWRIRMSMPDDAEKSIVKWNLASVQD